MMRRIGLALAAALTLIGAAHAERPTLVETPSLAVAVAQGKLPPVEARVPEAPAIAAPEAPGEPGGDLHILMANARDTRMMTVYGYTRLIRYTPELKLEPDVLRALDVEADRIFTLHLRPGHKWSDGHPFTAEDFRYWYEDVAQNERLSPTGVPAVLMVDGEKPRFEVLDPLTVRFTWPKANPRFLPELASPSPLYIFRPAHYLKPFHQKYADKAQLEDLVKKTGQRNWAALHNRLDNQYRNDNPELPTLDPWVLMTKPPSDRFIFQRNPFFHRVDAGGRQLPYIDRIIMGIANANIIPVKTGAGESDLQARYLRFDHYTFLKEAARRNEFDVRLWRTVPGAQLALFPNLNVNDPVWRTLLRDARFRRALSVGINRREINQVIYYGLAEEGQNTVLSGSPLFRPEYRQAWAQYDPKLANRLLDEIGLTKRNGEGTRLLPDGRPLQIIVENAGESSEQSDVLELIRDSWRDIGIKLFSKPSQREVFRNRVFAGETVMAIDKGFENGLPLPDMPPMEFAPTSQQQLQWPKWGQHVETKGKAGEPPDLPEGKRLAELYEAWLDAQTVEDRTAVWHEILKVHADSVLTIGLIAGVLQPVIVAKKLRNVPAEGIYNWDPGAHFGIYHPDEFWLAGEKRTTPPEAASAAAPAPAN